MVDDQCAHIHIQQLLHCTACARVYCIERIDPMGVICGARADQGLLVHTALISYSSYIVATVIKCTVYTTCTYE